MSENGVLRRLQDDRVAWWCPGCEAYHQVPVRPHPRGWEFDGNFSAPTFAPSVLVNSVKPLTDDEYERVMAGELIEPRSVRCHSFVRQGRIEFLGDCTHALAGQTVQIERREA